MSGTVHTATLSSRRTIADGVIEYVFDLPPEERSLTWRPGQFVSLQCGTDGDGQPILRSYSIASSPGSGKIALVVKIIPGGQASDRLDGLSTGEAVRFTGPMGFFVNDLSHHGDVLFAATGTGLAPVVPMLRELLARDEKGRVELYWGLRHEADLFWQEELAALAHPRLSTVTHLTQPDRGWRGATGRISPAVLDAAKRLHAPTFYLVGNGAMIREVKAGLQALGVDRKKQIRTEAFFD